MALSYKKRVALCTTLKETLLFSGFQLVFCRELVFTVSFGFGGVFSELAGHLAPSAQCSRSYVSHPRGSDVLSQACTESVGGLV